MTKSKTKNNKGPFIIVDGQTQFMPKKSEFASRFSKGVDELEEGADFVSYGITDGKHVNRIVIHGDEKLRDLILDALTNEDAMAHTA
jgi:hypothetical protein